MENGLDLGIEFSMSLLSFDDGTLKLCVGCNRHYDLFGNFVCSSFNKRYFREKHGCQNCPVNRSISVRKSVII